MMSLTSAVISATIAKPTTKATAIEIRLPEIKNFLKSS
jgi:hypothetical protein